VQPLYIQDVENSYAVCVCYVRARLRTRTSTSTRETGRWRGLSVKQGDLPQVDTVARCDGNEVTVKWQLERTLRPVSSAHCDFHDDVLVSAGKGWRVVEGLEEGGGIKVVVEGGKKAAIWHRSRR
jgi:hypothetical protein